MRNESAPDLNFDEIVEEAKAAAAARIGDDPEEAIPDPPNEQL